MKISREFIASLIASFILIICLIDYGYYKEIHDLKCVCMIPLAEKKGNLAEESCS